MYITKKYSRGNIKINTSKKAETLEETIKRAMNNGEKLEGQGELQYTERSEGVKAGFNVRTDKFDLAIEANDRIEQAKANIETKKREEAAAKEKGENDAPMEIVK